MLSVPDGRGLATLLNVTPVRSQDGAVASVVVTLQDLAPLAELDHMRARFVGMVSHNLLRRVWRGRDAADPKRVRSFVKRLRRQFGDDAHRPACIETERAACELCKGPSR